MKEIKLGDEVYPVIIIQLHNRTEIGILEPFIVSKIVRHNDKPIYYVGEKYPYDNYVESELFLTYEEAVKESERKRILIDNEEHIRFKKLKREIKLGNKVYPIIRLKSEPPGSDYFVTDSFKVGRIVERITSEGTSQTYYSEDSNGGSSQYLKEDLFPTEYDAKREARIRNSGRIEFSTKKETIIIMKSEYNKLKETNEQLLDLLSRIESYYWENCSYALRKSIEKISTFLMRKDR